MDSMLLGDEADLVSQISEVGVMVVLKGMNILINGKIINRYVYLLKDGDYQGVIKINRGVQLVIKSSDPLRYQWVATEWDDEIGAQLLDCLE